VKRLVLLGGGHAHVHVLQALARERLAGVEVVLVTPFLRQMYSGMVPGLVAGHYTADQCAIPLAPLAQAAGVRLVEGAAVGLDAAARRVPLAGGEALHYDLLSLDTGAVMDRERLPGAREHGLFVRPIEHFVARLEGLLQGAAQSGLDIAVIGGGAAGVELALGLRHRLTAQGTAGSADKPAARITLVTGGPVPLAGYPAGVIRRMQRVLAARGVAVVRDTCTAVEASALVLGIGARLACQAAVIATGAEAPAWLAGSGLALDERGFVLTGMTLQSVSHPEVFAAGDVATRADAPHAKSGVYAVRAGPPLALNLRRFLAGAELQPHRPQQRTLNLISCGDKVAIAAWGGWSAQGRWVWWWKDRIDRSFVARYSAPAAAAPS
jgi:pyridine nucleotide-disulfide oxidoreductase family protein